MIKTVLIWLLFYGVVTVITGCDTPELGEYRRGPYSWKRAAKPNEIAITDLYGVYVCQFTEGKSTIQLKDDGTYLLEVFRNGKRNVTFGPSEWYVYCLDCNEPSITFKDFPVSFAVFQSEMQEKDSTSWTIVGFNNENVITLAIGTDPDNDFYFPQTEKKESVQ